jgi:enoyl-CoA hydratase
MTGSIDREQRDHVAWLVINDEAKHNAMSLGMWQSLAQHMQALEADPQVRVVVLRGAGSKAFVSGANISEFEQVRGSAQATESYNAAVAAAQSALARARMPVIAAISGICFGGGMGLALSCDIRYASRDARFRIPAARLGLAYAYDGVRALLQQLRPADLAEVLFAARIFQADEAQRAGMVNTLCDDVFGHAEAMAQTIAQNAPLSVAAAKRAMRYILAGQAETDAMRAMAVACFDSEDYKEGRLAFAEKRQPAFRGR